MSRGPARAPPDTDLEPAAEVHQYDSRRRCTTRETSADPQTREQVHQKSRLRTSRDQVSAVQSMSGAKGRSRARPAISACRVAIGRGAPQNQSWFR